MKSTWIVLVAALATGCLRDRHDDGGQFGEENGYGCVPVARTPLGDDEVSALGFAPRALFDLAVDAAVPFTYDDGSTTELTLVPEVTGPAELVDYEWSGDGATEMTAALGCPDQVELPVRLGFTTSDDGFREQVAMRLGAATPDRADGYATLTEFEGDFDPWSFAGADNDYDSVQVDLVVAFSGSGPEGALAAVFSGTDGDVAFAERFAIGAWGPTSE